MVGIALGGCGGSDSATDDPEAMLDSAFAKAIPSADLRIEAELGIDGLAGFEEPLDIVARGPYIAGKRQLPQFDIDVEIGSDDLGQTVQLGLLSTGDRLFVEFAGSYFEQPRADVARANRRIAKSAGNSEPGSLAELGLDPRAWISDAKVVGDSKVGGVETDHIEGTLDVEAMLEDLNGLVRRSADLTGGGEAAKPLTEAQIERLSRSVEDPKFDIHLAKDDGLLRRISLTLDVTVPKEDRDRVGGITGASIRFSVQFDDVGGDQEVSAPQRARPMSELTSQLGGLSLFGIRPNEGSSGGSGSEGSGGSDGADVEPSPGGADPDAAAGGAADAFQRYGECLDRAGPDESDAITRCAELLQ